MDEEYICPYCGEYTFPQFDEWECKEHEDTTEVLCSECNRYFNVWRTYKFLYSSEITAQCEMCPAADDAGMYGWKCRVGGCDAIPVETFWWKQWGGSNEAA